MQSDSKGKKRPYSPPVVTKLTSEQAKQFIAHRATCSDQEAAHFVESLRRQHTMNAAATKCGCEEAGPTERPRPDAGAASFEL